MDELTKCVEVLIAKAAKAEQSGEALQFSQAACNAANALAQLQNVKHLRFPPKAEQPDELREAAAALLAMAEAAHAGAEFASDGVVVDAMTRLRKALQ